MQRRDISIRFLAVGVAVVLAWWLGTPAAPTRGADRKVDLTKLPAAAQGEIDFDRDIRPIFARACISCHSAAKQRAGLRLDVGSEAMKGGNSGPVIKPGDVAGSSLLPIVAGLDPDVKMPPEGKPPLAVEEIAKLRAWIEQGAKWGKDEIPVEASRPKSNHWAFQPIRKVEPPTVKNTAWVRNGIDAFILARLEAEQLTPAEEADRPTLLRRLSLDLLGLPPSPKELADFLADNQPDAYERLVDRLLASPHYGERWARHWLDAARYADSDGYEKDSGRPYAWRYRRWVIEALNRDLPFDQFTVEQLAGDLLPDATVEQKAATGFHRNTLTNKEGGVDPEQFRVEQVVDRVSTTAKVWLGVTMNCCQCHDHKYDPLTQREFYQLLAFFNSDEEVDLPAPIPGELESYTIKKAEFDAKLKEKQAAVEAYRKDELPAAQLKWENDLKLADLRKLSADLRAALLVEPGQRDEAAKKLVAQNYDTLDKRLGELTKAVNDIKKTEPRLTHAPTIARGKDRKTHVMIRGDFLRLGVEVTANTPAVLPELKPAGDKPSRLDLARWLVDPANPLTARVIVNWIWHKYFTRGIVPTLEDFGTQGEKPSHPELLDWLASEFVRQRWSLKQFHKLVVTSATYRQSSKVRPELQQRDPLNVLLARQARPRLEAEIVRDLCLAASGLIQHRIGGPSVRPPQPAGISELTYADSVKWVESKGPDRYRRGLYTWFQRTSPYPMLMTFDAPDSNVSCTRRERSNTPLQALTLLNDPVFVECAQALALRIVREQAGSTADRITHGFRLCLGRDPTVVERDRLLRLYADLLQIHQAKPEAAAKLVGETKFDQIEKPEAATWIAVARTLMNLDEFLTRN